MSIIRWMSLVGMGAFDPMHSTSRTSSQSLAAYTSHHRFIRRLKPLGSLSVLLCRGCLTTTRTRFPRPTITPTSIRTRLFTMSTEISCLAAALTLGQSRFSPTVFRMVRTPAPMRDRSAVADRRRHEFRAICTRCTCLDVGAIRRAQFAVT